MLRSVRALLCCLSLALVPAAAHAAELDTMGRSEIEALQRRLADATCYAGPIDGTLSDELAKAVAACPPQDPRLTIDTGMHVAMVNRIAVDRACRIAATASDDKTLRLWSLPDGNLLRTLRIPVGPGNGGKVYATAVSPDGRYVAAGGWDEWRDRIAGVDGVYIFDAATGALVTRAGAFDSTVMHLAFSPDGRWLEVSLGSGQGMRVLDTSTWKQVASDKPYGEVSYGATFGPDGRLYTASFDGKVRRYGPGPGFAKQREFITKSGKQPFSLSVSPDGRRLAVGYYDAARIDILDAETLAPRPMAQAKDIDNGSLHAVSWSADGTRIMAGGQFQIEAQFPVITFDRDGKRVGTPQPVSHQTIMSLQPCATGFAVGAGDPGLGLVDATGRTKVWKRGVAPELVDHLGNAFTVSDDAKRVRFGFVHGGAQPVLFDLAAAALTDAPDPVPGLSPARTEGLPITGWQRGTAPAVGGTAIPLDTYEHSRSIAVRADNTGFILGADFNLRSIDANGKKRWSIPVPGVAWGVNLSADGRIVVVAYDDGTIRWHRWSDGQELLALFVNRDTRAWVLWTPSGYYSASPGAEDMIGWHLNRGWTQGADFFPASRFRDTFSRPDIVGRILETLDEDEAVKLANKTAKRHEETKPLIERLPPVLTILSPGDGAGVEPGTVAIAYSVRSPSGTPVDRIEAFVDGAKADAKGLARPDGAFGAITLPMPSHDAVVSLIAYTGTLASDSVQVHLKSKGGGSPDEADALKPTLYALLVGVSHYGRADMDLQFAAKDARDLGEVLKEQKGRLYKDVQIKVLTDAEATSTGIKYGLAWLKQKSTDRDLAIVFVAGHGTTDAKNRFWFLTADADPNVLSTAVPGSDITDALFDLPGKKMLFLDACHSGAALNQGARGLAPGGMDINAALNDFSQAEGGVVAFAASTGREFSFERDTWQHGAFTKALIEAIGQGKADIMKKGTITTATLDAFLAERVKELTDGRQHPTMTRPKTVPDFPIALVK